MTYEEWFKAEGQQLICWRDDEKRLMRQTWEASRQNRSEECANLTEAHADKWADAEGETDGSYIGPEFRDLAAEIRAG